jgi:hypothetical protein
VKCGYSSIHIRNFFPAEEICFVVVALFVTSGLYGHKI